MDTSQYLPPVHGRLLKVFLCHAREDKSAVEQIYHRLKTRGVRPWLDKYDILGGQQFVLAIRQAIQDTDVVVVCLSPESRDKTGTVQWEIQMAVEEANKRPPETIFIIPAKLKPCSIPLLLQKWNAIEIWTEEGFQRLVDALLDRAAKMGIGSLWATWPGTSLSPDDFTAALFREIDRTADRVAELFTPPSPSIPPPIPHAGSDAEYAKALNKALESEKKALESEKDDSPLEVDITVLDEDRKYVAHVSWPPTLGKSHNSIWSGSVDPKFSDWFFARVEEMTLGKLAWIDNMADWLSPKKRLKRKTVVAFRSVDVTPEIRWTVAIEGHELATTRK